MDALKDHQKFRQQLRQQLQQQLNYIFGDSAQITSPASAPEVNEMNPTASTTIVNAECLMPSEGSLIPSSESSPANTESSPALAQLNDNLLSAQKGIENITERVRDLILLLMECVHTLNHEIKQLKPVIETATSLSSISPQADGADTGESFK